MVNWWNPLQYSRFLQIQGKVKFWFCDEQPKVNDQKSFFSYHKKKISKSNETMRSIMGINREKMTNWAYLTGV